MKQHQALKAYTTIIALGKRATGQTAFALYKLKQQLKQLVDYQAEAETNLVEKYGGKIADNGIVVIEDEENRRKFVAEKVQLDNMDIAKEVAPVTIIPEQIPDINIDEIEALNGFVNFE